MKRYTDQVLSATTGLLLLNATISVVLAGTNTPATLYVTNDPNSPPMNNPFLAPTGEFFFFVANGVYDISATVSGDTTTVPDVEIFDIVGLVGGALKGDKGDTGDVTPALSTLAQQAMASSAQAGLYAAEALGAALSVGPGKFFSSNAAAVAALPTLTNGSAVWVAPDETHNNHLVIYYVANGSLNLGADLSILGASTPDRAALFAQLQADGLFNNFLEK